MSELDPTVEEMIDLMVSSEQLAQLLLAACEGHHPADCITALSMALVEVIRQSSVDPHVAARRYIDELVRIVDDEFSQPGNPADPDYVYKEALPEAHRSAYATSGST